MLILFINHIWFSIPLKCEQTKNISEHFPVFNAFKWMRPLDDAICWLPLRAVSTVSRPHITISPVNTSPFLPLVLSFYLAYHPWKDPIVCNMIWLDFSATHFQSQKKNVLSRYLLWVMIEPWILPSKNYWGFVSSRVCWFLVQTCPFPFVCSELNLFSGSYTC